LPKELEEIADNKKLYKEFWKRIGISVFNYNEFISVSLIRL
jgi:hypothetical protein